MSDDPLAKVTDEMRDLMERAAHYAKSTISDDTRRCYEREFRHFRKWCEERHLPCLPMEVSVVAVYLAALADGNVEIKWLDNRGHQRVSKKPYKYASIRMVYQSIIHMQRAAGHEWTYANPTIAKVIQGIAHRKGTRKKQAIPLQIDDLKLVLSKMRERRYEDLTVIRDKAILSLCFFGAFRRGELVAIEVRDLTFTDQGLIVLVRKSKTDPTSEGEEVGIVPQKDGAICPIRLLQDWLSKSEIKQGAIFRRLDRNGCLGPRGLTGQSVAFIVKDYVERAGLDPEGFSGHSLRAGFVTTAAAKGVSLNNIMRQTRHKDQRTAMTYIRHATVFDSNATEGLGDDDE